MDDPNRNILVRDYIQKHLSIEDEILRYIRIHSLACGLPEIHVPPYVGQFLHLIAKIQQAQRILEIGTLGGYSTVWLARALPSDGTLLSLEISAKYAQLAKEHIVKAKLDQIVTIERCDALDRLPQLIQEKIIPFDLIFIDANKESDQFYLESGIQLSHPGSLILIDNLIPKGEVVGTPCHHEAAAVYAFHPFLAQHPCLEIAFMTTIVRPTGQVDCLSIARVKP